MKWSTPWQGRSNCTDVDGFSAAISCRGVGKAKRFDVGVAVGQGSWRWKTLKARTWPSARKQAPTGIAELLRQHADELLTASKKLEADAVRLRDEAGRLVRGA